MYDGIGVSAPSLHRDSLIQVSTKLLECYVRGIHTIHSLGPRPSTYVRVLICGGGNNAVPRKSKRARNGEGLGPRLHYTHDYANNALILVRYVCNKVLIRESI